MLQPILQGRSLGLHPAVVVLAVTAGGGAYGITGASLSVPVVAVAAVVLRHLGEVLDGGAPPAPADDVADTADGEAERTLSTAPPAD